MKRIKEADLWVRDKFLEQGLEALFRERVVLHDNLRFVFFTIDYYYDVKAQNYDLSAHRLIFLTQGYSFRFLNDFRMYRLDVNETLDTIHSFIVEISWNSELVDSVTYENMILTIRDRVLIEQLSNGKNVAKIATLNQLHYKTVYQNRQDLMKKFGCESLVDFLKCSKTKFSKNGFSRCSISNPR